MNNEPEEIGNPVKRYLVFSGNDYYPSGGWYDLKDSYDTIEEAIPREYFIEDCNNWLHIADTHTGKIVKKFTAETDFSCPSNLSWVDRKIP